MSGAVIVEVHPAVAIWMWCVAQGRKNDLKWNYKKDNALMIELWKILLTVPAFFKALPESLKGCPKDDDVFDARVAYVLGSIWINGGEDVVLLGDVNRGSFLVPNVQGVVNCLSAF